MTSVSYVVTVYNKVPVLPFLVAGLGAQEGDFDREFIFVDDGSTDDSRAVLRALTAGWSDVTIVGQANAGPAPALNAGFRRARGDYVKPMDADDLLLPWATRRLLEAIEPKQQPSELILPGTLWCEGSRTSEAKSNLLKRRQSTSARKQGEGWMVFASMSGCRIASH